MLVGYDASRAFVNEATGTENYSLNLLRALAKIDRKNRYRVYLREGSMGPVSSFPPASAQSSGSSKPSQSSIPEALRAVGSPSSAAIHRTEWPPNFEFKVVRPYRFWTQLGLALETWRNPVDILFIPAHTLPILRRRKIGKGTTSGQSTTGIKSLLSFLRAHGTRDTLGARDTRYVVTIHDLGVEYLPGYHQFPQRYYLDFASRYAARHTDALIAVSASTKRDLIKRYRIDPKKVFVVPEGVDRRLFKPQSKSNPSSTESRRGREVKSVKSKFNIKEPYILFVGTVQPRKNLVHLIEAFSILLKRVSQVSRVSRVPRAFKKQALDTPGTLGAHGTLSLVIAGKLGWDYDGILSAPKKFGVEGRVKFLGYVGSRDLPALYSGAAVCAFPSLFEGFDLPILEALACGCKVVASDIPPHREIYRKIFHFPPLRQGFAGRAGSIFHLSKHFPIEESKINGKWQMEYGKSRFNEAMTLVKPNDIKLWSHVLYQYISQYEISKPFTSFQKQLASKFSWEEAVKSTLAVFEGLLS